MNNAGPSHVMQNPPECMHGVQNNANLIDLDVYISAIESMFLLMCYDVLSYQI